LAKFHAGSGMRGEGGGASVAPPPRNKLTHASLSHTRLALSHTLSQTKPTGGKARAAGSTAALRKRQPQGSGVFDTCSNMVDMERKSAVILAWLASNSTT
jgi:hypothetical protein